MNNPFVGFETFAKQRIEDDEHPYGEDTHLDEDSILERSGDVETDDDYYEPEDNVDLQWGKVSDAAKGAVGAAKSGVASAAMAGKEAAQTAGTAVGAKASDAAQTAKGFGQAAGATIGAAGQKAAQTAQTAGTAAVGAGMDVAHTAGQTAKGFGQAAGAKVGQAAQDAGAAIGAAGQQAARAGMDTAQAAGATVGQAAKTAGGLVQDAASTGIAAGQRAASSAGQKVAGAFGKSHDDMMVSLDQAIGFMEKQVENEQDFYEEPTGSRTAVQNVSRGGMVGEGDVDPLDTSEEFEYTPEPNAAQMAAIQEASRERQQGIAANKKYEAERAVPSSREQDQGQYPEANDFPSSEAGPSPSHFSEEEVLDSLRVPEGRKRRGVLTPENISTSARENRLEEEDRQRLKDERIAALAQRSQIKTERESTALTPMEKPKRPPISDIGDDFSQSADSVLAKALGSVIGIMEKQDPRFRCQECGTKIPKGSRSCRKCGSEDIDLA